MFPYIFEQIRQFRVTDQNNRSRTVNEVNSEIKN